MNYNEIRDTAWKILIRSGINKLPVSLHQIAKVHNIDIIKNSDCYLLADNELAVSLFFNDRLKIIYDDTLMAQRIRFSIAHELGHIFLEHKNKKNYYSEKEADMFAIHLLAPACILERLKINSAEELAELCQISKEASEIRFNRLVELRKRDKFFISHIEKDLHNQFKNFINENSKK